MKIKDLTAHFITHTKKPPTSQFALEKWVADLHMVRLARFERATPCLGGRCSIQLSYNRSASILTNALSSGKVFFQALWRFKFTPSPTVCKSISPLRLFVCWFSSCVCFSLSFWLLWLSSCVWSLSSPLSGMM